MTDPVKNAYPPKIEKNTFFNFTNYLVEDMSTFLATYAASIQTISNHSTNETLWTDVAKTVFLETRNGKQVKKRNGSISLFLTHL